MGLNVLFICLFVGVSIMIAVYFLVFYTRCYDYCSSRHNSDGELVYHDDSDEVISFTDTTVIPPGLEPIYYSRHDNL